MEVNLEGPALYLQLPRLVNAFLPFTSLMNYLCRARADLIEEGVFTNIMYTHFTLLMLSILVQRYIRIKSSNNAFIIYAAFNLVMSSSL